MFFILREMCSCEQGRGEAEGERERERERERVLSRLCAVSTESDAGLELTKSEIVT